MVGTRTISKLLEKRLSLWQMGWITAGVSIVWAGLWVLVWVLAHLMDFLEANRITREIPIAQPFVFAGFAGCFAAVLVLPGLLLWLSQHWLPPNASRWRRLGVGMIAFWGPIGGGLGLLWLGHRYWPWMGEDVMRLLDMRTFSWFLVSAAMMSLAIRTLGKRLEGSHER